MSYKKPVKRQSTSAAPENIDELTGDQEYVCCGRFCVDFAKVCAVRGVPYVPEVVLRPCPPYKMEAQAQKKAKETETSKTKKSKNILIKRDSYFGLTPGSAAEAPKKKSTVVNHSGLHLPPAHFNKTYVTKDNFTYAMPRIQVEQEVADDDRTVSETHIREWRVDAAMMQALTQCWRALPALHTLHLWNTGLDAAALAALADALPHCPRLTTLVLDNNPLTSLPVTSLLTPDSPLEHLSLRWCGLGDAEVQGIALALDPTARSSSDSTSPSSCTSVVSASLNSASLISISQAARAASALVTLNLAGNRVGDAGVGHLAAMLPLNRTLLVLNLTSNAVTDEGAERLAEALSWFHVTGRLLELRRGLIHAELVTRLHVDGGGGGGGGIGIGGKSNLPSFSQDVGGGGGASATSKKSVKVRGGSGVSPTSGGKSSVPQERLLPTSAQGASRKSDAGVSREDRYKKRATTAPGKGKRKELGLGEHNCPRRMVLEVDPALKIERPRVKPAWHSESEDTEVLSYGTGHPLMQAGYLHRGQLWLPGNRTLVSLNLSRNGIGERGLNALLAAVKEQVLPPPGGRGLLRLVVGRNPLDVGSPAAEALRRVMSVRDPMFRCPNIDLCKGSISPCAIPPLCTF